MGTDILVGKQTVVCEPRHGSSSLRNFYLLVELSILHVELDIVFSADNDAGHPTEPTTLTLMITASATAATLQSAEEAMKAINTIKAWKSAVKIIKLVMDAVTPIAAVCPISFFPHPLLKRLPLCS
jgi:hypothetical protein